MSFVEVPKGYTVKVVRTARAYRFEVKYEGSIVGMSDDHYPTPGLAEQEGRLYADAHNRAEGMGIPTKFSA